jgi:hypothetical protein
MERDHKSNEFLYEYDRRFGRLSGNPWLAGYEPAARSTARQKTAKTETLNQKPESANGESRASAFGNKFFRFLFVDATKAGESVEHDDTSGSEPWLRWLKSEEEFIRQIAAALDHDVLDAGDAKRARADRAEQRAIGVLDVWALLLPAPVSSEILGDYIEDIHRRALAGQGRAKIYIRMLAAIFWTCVNAIGILLKEIGSRKAA